MSKPNHPIFENMKQVLDFIRPSIDVCMQNPEDWFIMHPGMARKIGNKLATLAGTIALYEARQKVSNQLIKRHFCGLVSEATIKRQLHDLEEKGLISAYFMEPEEIVSLLKEKNLTGQGIGKQVCDWCGYGALSLDAHHYPEHKKNGGQDTVNICQNCHKEYHYLAGQAGRPAFFYYKVNIENYQKLLGDVSSDRRSPQLIEGNG